MKKQKFIMSSAISLALAAIMTTGLIYNAYFREPISESEAIAIAKAHFTEKYGDVSFRSNYKLVVFDFDGYYQIGFLDPQYLEWFDGDSVDVLIDRRTGKIIDSYSLGNIREK